MILWAKHKKDQGETVMVASEVTLRVHCGSKMYTRDEILRWIPILPICSGVSFGNAWGGGVHDMTS